MLKLFAHAISRLIKWGGKKIKFRGSRNHMIVLQNLMVVKDPLKGQHFDIFEKKIN